MKKQFLTIYDWMLGLGLTYTELVAYAVVWSFSRDGEGWFQGSSTYIAKWMCVSTKRPVLKALASLVGKGLVEKSERWENGVRLCDYRAIRGGVPKTPVVSEKHQGGARKTPGGGAPGALHNKDIDNDTIVSKRDNRAHMRVMGGHGTRFQEVWEMLLRQPGWSGKSREALDECLKDLSEVPEEVAIEMMRNSIKNGWKGLFPLERKVETDAESPIAAAERLEREAFQRMAAYAADNNNTKS